MKKYWVVGESEILELCNCALEIDNLPDYETIDKFLEDNEVVIDDDAVEENSKDIAEMLRDAIIYSIELGLFEKVEEV